MVSRSGRVFLIPLRNCSLNHNLKPFLKPWSILWLVARIRLLQIVVVCPHILVALPGQFFLSVDLFGSIVVLDDVYSALIKFVKFPHLLQEPCRLWSPVKMKGRRIALTMNRPLHFGKVSANFLSDCDGDGIGHIVRQTQYIHL